MANEFTRITHHVSGSANIPVNSNQSTVLENLSSTNTGCLILPHTDNNVYAELPVSGYDEISLKLNSTGGTSECYFILSDSTATTPISLTDTFSNWIAIPDSAVVIKVKALYKTGSSSYTSASYALK